MPPSIYTKHNEKHRNGKGVFLFVSLLTAGLCSLYPMCCFHNYSSKSKAKSKQAVADLEQSQKEAAEYQARKAYHRSRSPPDTAYVPRNRHSSTRRHESRRREDRHRSRQRY
ncbi:hypothetical protein CERZMDRAFT_91728 [Cercospora zeae-maydis SCOH1-5]|uniref:Uncharacterized protein n=1 Tax=Cercospora zeae-maydis SCOH1-5 TaxID=717836 RepID=A0A6A6F5N2_9PEZI|nr:hypothetical protein CERZMDRAFT_91728 [Cercospora zeae-maydis SCOH1-5]